MQILTINNQNFQKPSRNPCNRTKVKILEKRNCAADFSLLNLPKGKSLGRSKPATNS